jgi:Fe-S oxidoreductase
MTVSQDSEKDSGWAAKAACGRDVSGQIADIRTYGTHGTLPVLRSMALGASGFLAPRARGRYALLFGCYRPFSTPYVVRDVGRLFALLDVDYTWLLKEYCCGLPLLNQVERAKRPAMVETAREFVNGNVALARDRGAQTLVYCCAGCAHAAKASLPETRDAHVYVLDLLLDGLAARSLRVEPQTVAYFEGCHTSYRKPYPETSLDWGRYRRFLETVAGLTVIDIPNTMCCKQRGPKIVAIARDAGASALVTPCSGCNVALRAAGAGVLPVLSYPELLLRCLEPEGVQDDAS